MFVPQTLGISLVAASAALAGCVPADGAGKEEAAVAVKAEYLGIETVPMDKEMVNFRLTMKGAKTEADVEAYGRCAAAQYALTRHAGFVRHVRTSVDKQGKTWRGDAIYLISAALPDGLKVIEAEVQVRDCGELGIPTV